MIKEGQQLGSMTYNRIDFIVKLVLVTFFISVLHSVLSASSLPGLMKDVIVISIHTDAFPDETTLSLIDANSYELIFSSVARIQTANTLYQDTILLDANRCLRVILEDTGGDGFLSGGYYELSFNNLVIDRKSSYASRYEFSFNCGEGLICETAVPITSGTELLKKKPITGLS